MPTFSGKPLQISQGDALKWVYSAKQHHGQNKMDNKEFHKINLHTRNKGRKLTHNYKGAVG